MVVILDIDDNMPAAEQLDRIRAAEISLRAMLAEHSRLPRSFVQAFSVATPPAPIAAARERYWFSSLDGRPTNERGDR